MNLAERMTLMQWATAIVLFAAMTTALAGVFLYAPNERAMGVMQKIFYFHVSSAWIGFFAFGVAFVCSLGYLLSRKPLWDQRALAAAELGVLFCTVVMVTGPIWARGAWGVYWVREDLRLTTTLVLWLIYIAYLMLRATIPDPARKATVAAAVAIMGFFNVPIVYMSIRWWRTHHPAPVLMGGENSGLDPRMKLVFFFCLATFTLLFFYLYAKRVRLASLEREIDDLYRQLE